MDTLLVTNYDTTTVLLGGGTTNGISVITDGTQKIIWQGNEELEIKVESTYLLPIKIGAKCTVFGRVYILNYPPSIEQVNSKYYRYTFIFEGVHSVLSRILLFNTDVGSSTTNEMDFEAYISTQVGSNIAEQHGGLQIIIGDIITATFYPGGSTVVGATLTYPQFITTEQPAISELTRVQVHRTVTTQTVRSELEFTMAGTVDELMGFITFNFTRVNDPRFSLNIVNNDMTDPTLVRLVEFSNDNCLTALKKICDSFRMRYDLSVQDTTINITLFYQAERRTYSETLYVGQGLTSCIIKPQAGRVFANRLFPIGTERNIPWDYRGFSRKLLPLGLPYVQDSALISAHGVYEAVSPQEGIYPRLNGSVTGIGGYGTVTVPAPIDYPIEISTYGVCPIVRLLNGADKLIHVGDTLHSVQSNPTLEGAEVQMLDLWTITPPVPFPNAALNKNADVWLDGASAILRSNSVQAGDTEVINIVTQSGSNTVIINPTLSKSIKTGDLVFDCPYIADGTPILIVLQDRFIISGVATGTGNTTMTLTRITTQGVENCIFTDVNMPFDLMEQDEEGNTLYLIDGLSPKITFNSGELAGYSFAVKKYTHADKQFEIIPVTDERGLKMPSKGFSIQAGDKYILTDIRLPDEYITGAETELRDFAEDYLYPDISHINYEADVELNDIWIRTKYASTTGLTWFNSDVPFTTYARTLNTLFEVGFLQNLSNVGITLPALFISSIERDVMQPIKYNKIVLSANPYTSIALEILRRQDNISVMFNKHPINRREAKTALKYMQK